MDEIKLREVINQELKESIKKYGEHKNKFESYGVLLEELDEMMEELKELLEIRESLWQNIKSNDIKNLELDVGAMKMRSFLLLKEIVQVSAMLEKFKIND